MSLDGGYMGSLDHALANLHVGRNQGLAEGIAEGRALGQDEGYQAGFSEGWGRAAAEGNRLLREQFLTSQTVAQENAHLRQLVKHQAESMAALKARLAHCEQDLQRMTGRTREGMWQHNRAVVCMNAMRGVLQEIFSLRDGSSIAARDAFVRFYKANVSKALADGTIELAPHEDETFKQALPKTVKFIDDQLSP
ncbi:hypothetical protein [Aquabacterium sp.]|uniref:hypothetical protein n=1 Tax=Aquabacterium sp. TaxID=1872578 RepID=UPI003D6D934A